MTDAQKYINQNYPDKKIKFLNIENKDLEGELDLSEFTNLEELNCSYNELTNLDISQCSNLSKLNCNYNSFDDLEFLAKLPYPEKLTFLNIDNCGCEIFLSLEEVAEKLIPFVNLGKISTAQKWLDQNYPKEKREEVRKLNISNQNLEGELDLGDFYRLEKLYCSNNQLTSLDLSNCPKLTYLSCESNQFTDLDLEGCSELTELKCCKDQLKNKDLDLSKFPQLSKDKITWTYNAQQWLDKNYPQNGLCQRETDDSSFDDESEEWNNKGKTGTKIVNLDISRQGLEGFLQLTDFPNLQEFKCDSNKLTQLEIINCPRLEIINCESNALNSLKLDQCQQLGGLLCGYNKLTSIEFLQVLPHPERLEYLNISFNKFLPLDLTFLTPLVNLWELKLNDNNFIGSLQPLAQLTELEELDISNTNLNSGVEYLPDSLGSISYRGVKEIKEDLDKYVAEKWLDKNYLKEERGEITELSIGDEHLRGNLKLTGFTNLQKLRCCGNKKLINLDLSGCTKLEELDYHINELDSLNLGGCYNLKRVRCSNNDALINLDLSDCINLEELICSRNKNLNIDFLQTIPYPERLKSLDITILKKDILEQGTKPNMYYDLYPSSGREWFFLESQHDSDDSQYKNLKKALEELQIQGSILSLETIDSVEVSDYRYSRIGCGFHLGLGLRCGFLGSLHHKTVCERLEKEYNCKVFSHLYSFNKENTEKLLKKQFVNLEELKLEMDSGERELLCGTALSRSERKRRLKKSIKEVEKEINPAELNTKIATLLSQFQEINKEKNYAVSQEKFEEIIREKETNIKGEITDIQYFPTWFNPNCALVISQKDSKASKPEYKVSLVIYEPPYKDNGDEKDKKMEKILKVSEFPNSILKKWYPTLEKAEEKVKKIKEKLNSDNPILAVLKKTFKPVNTMEKIILDPKNVEDNPDDFLKPLDIIWRKMAGTSNYHAAAYLGKGQVIHISSDPEKKDKDDKKSFIGKAISTKKEFGARITSWIDFWHKSEEKLIRHHPVIPFKRPEKIIEHIIKVDALEYGKGDYNVLLENCEHLATLCVCGFTFSAQADKIEDRINIAKEIKKNDEVFALLNLEAIPEINLETQKSEEQVEMIEEKITTQIEIPPKK